MDGVTIDTSELDGLIKAFQNFSATDQRSIWMSAFRKAAMPIVDAAKMYAPFRRGNLQRSIGEMAVNGEVSLWVGSILKTPYLTPRGRLSKVWYGLLTEGGADNVGRPAGNSSRKLQKSRNLGGHIEGKHWFRNARLTTEQGANDMIVEEWQNAIERIIIRRLK